MIIKNTVTSEVYTHEIKISATQQSNKNMYDQTIWNQAKSNQTKSKMLHCVQRHLIQGSQDESRDLVQKSKHTFSIENI